MNLRIGTEARGEGSSRESTINLIKPTDQSSTHYNGFDADVAINTYTGDVGESAAHEVGHTMGLPHVFDATVEGVPPGEMIFQDKSLVKPDNPNAGNLMMPGPFPRNLRGHNITESQILHIRDDYNSGLLNSETIRGSDQRWGTKPTDTPVFKFIYSPFLKRQTLIQTRGQ